MTDSYELSRRLGLYIPDFTAELPDNRWFTPTEKFWEIIASFGKQLFVDCGCGTGALTQEALDRELVFLAIDLMPRRGQAPGVLQLDATSMPFSKHMWPLICRPNHSGWAYYTICSALRRGADAFYVGLTSNIDIDLEGLVPYTGFSNVGEEGEVMLWFKNENC